MASLAFWGTRLQTFWRRGLGTEGVAEGEAAAGKGEWEGRAKGGGRLGRKEELGLAIVAGAALSLVSF